jgi:hypothetical protein
MLMKLFPSLVIIVTSINKKGKERIKAEEKKQMKYKKKEVLIFAILPFPVLGLKYHIVKIIERMTDHLFFKSSRIFF